MKIAKKILAGTLALMSTFTVVSAEPVKNETPSSDSTSAKSEKSNDRSTKKELAKVAGIVGGAAAVVGGAIVLFREIFKTHEVENNRSLSETLRRILECYLVSRDPNSKINELLERYKETELVKALMDLFIALDVNGLVNKECVIRSLKCVDSYMGIFGRKSGCDELIQALNEISKKVKGYGFECLTPEYMSSSYFSLMFNGSDMYCSICADSIADFSKNEEAIMKIHSSDGKSVYDLKAILIRNKEDCYHTIVCAKNEAGLWNMCFLDGSGRKPIGDDYIVSELLKCSEKINLFYVKQN